MQHLLSRILIRRTPPLSTRLSNYFWFFIYVFCVKVYYSVLNYNIFNCIEELEKRRISLHVSICVVNSSISCSLLLVSSEYRILDILFPPKDASLPVFGNFPHDSFSVDIEQKRWEKSSEYCLCRLILYFGCVRLVSSVSNAYSPVESIEFCWKLYHKLRNKL